MPIVKPRTRRVKRIRHICRLLEPTRNVLMDYSRFINDSPDYVLNALIDATLAKDRDFLNWRAEQQTASSAEQQSSPVSTTAANDSIALPRPRPGTSA